MKIIHLLTDYGAVKADKEVPDNYKPQKNESFTLPTIPAYTTDYQPIQQAISSTSLEELHQQVVVLQSMAMQQNQANAKLQAINQQQAKQIEQLQQMFMLANQQQAVADKKGENQQ